MTVSGYDRLPEGAAEVFGEGATAALSYDLLTVDVPAASWTGALATARDELGCTFFDWLSAVDEPGTGFQVCAHVVALGTRSEGSQEPEGSEESQEPEGSARSAGGTGRGAAPGPHRVRRLLVRTTVPYDDAVLPTATGLYPGAAWHERETHEMFGVGFTGHPGLAPLLLPEEFEGHPLRKDFVLASRVVKAWPGAVEPGESHDGGPRRRQMLPPGVPDPNEWGPLKGQLPPAARTPRTPRAAGERPARRTRSASEGSASQQPPASAPPRGRVPDAPWEQPPPAEEKPGPGDVPGRRADPDPGGEPGARDPGPDGEPGARDPGPGGEPGARDPGPGGEPGARDPGPDGEPGARDEPPAGGDQ